MGKKPENNNSNKKKQKKNKKTEQDGGGTGGKKQVITDPRFSSVHFDPRFQKVRKQQSKVTIDSRFNRMFTDKNFASSSAPVDKRGKPRKQNSADPLRDYYNIEEEDSSKSNSKSKKKIIVESEDDYYEEDSESGSDNESEEEEEDEIDIEDLKKLDEKLAAESDGDGGSTNSDTDTDDEDDVDVFASEEESEEEPEEEVPTTEQETHRLAIVNMDWSQVKAADLYVAMNSFVPSGGQILSVSVYPSEFGQKRMEEEAIKGPIGLFDSGTEESNDEDSEEYEVEKLRAYELSRLRYYYAVVECDSSATASYIYRNCDGVEFERSSNVFDLRFIPDAMQFDHPPRDVATEIPPRYNRLDFKTDVLQQSNIRLTWDKDEPQRVKALRRKFTDYEREEMDLMAYIAPDDSDDDEAADGQSDLEKYRALVGAEDGSDGDDGDDVNDMEVTFNTDLEDISKRILEKKDKESETVWEAYLRKKKEKKRAMRNKSKDSSEDDSSDSDQEAPEEPDDQEAPEEPDDFFVKEPSARNSKVGTRINGEKQEEDTKRDQEASRAELELLLADDQGADHNLKGYNIKAKKSKGKKGKEVPAEDKIPSAEYDDPRFSALYTSPLFALDPTDAQYKRSAAYARQVAQRQYKGVREGTTENEPNKPPRENLLPADDTSTKKSEQAHSDSIPSKMENPEISSMIRSMKRKAEQYQAKSNGKASKKAVTVPSKGLLPKLSSMFLSGKKKPKVSKS